MEISDVLVALEELKDGIAAVNSANANVERAATAARKVCEAFASCSSKLEGFPETVMKSFKKKVAEIVDASSQMVQSYSKSAKGLREETKSIAETFNTTVTNSCNRIQNDINGLSEKTNSIVETFNTTVTNSCNRIQNDVNEFHREMEAFEAKLSRMTCRVEEKADNVAAEVKKFSGSVHNDFQAMSKSQLDAFGNLHAGIDETKKELKLAIETCSDGLGESVAQESTNTRMVINTAKDNVLGGIGSVKKIAVAATVMAFLAAVCAALLVVKAYGS